MANIVECNGHPGNQLIADIAVCALIHKNLFEAYTDDPLVRVAAHSKNVISESIKIFKEWLCDGFQ